MKCPKENYAFYQKILKGFQELAKDISAEAQYARAFQVWQKTETALFRDWYGKGKRDSYDNPVVDDDYNYVSESGKKMSILDFRNDTYFDTNEKLSETERELDKEIKDHTELISKIKDILTKKIAIFKNKGTEEHKNILLELKERLEKAHTKEAIALFIKNAIPQINNSYTKLLMLIESGDVTAKRLSAFKDYVAAYDILEDVLYSLEKNSITLTSVNYNAIKEAIRQKDFIQKYYRDGMSPIIAKELAALSSFYTAEQLEEFLKNSPFDTSAPSLWLEFAGDSKDPIVSLVAKLVDDTYQTTRREHIEFRDRLLKVAQNLESSKGNPVDAMKLFDELIEKDLNGKPTGYLVSEYRMGEFMKERNKLKDAMNAIEDKESEEFNKAKNEYLKWMRENVEQRYNSKYYAIFDSLSEEARAARDKFLDAKREILNQYKVEHKTKEGEFSRKGSKYTFNLEGITDTDWEKIRELESELAWLKSEWYKDGSPKSGLDLKIAVELKEYGKKIGDVFEKVRRDDEGFNKARQRAFDLGIEHYNKWLVQNTKIKYKDEFWAEFKRIMEILDTGSWELEDIQIEINDLLRAYKDESGVVNGEEVPKHIRERVMQLTADKVLVKRGMAYEKNKVKSKSQEDLDREQAVKELNELVEYVVTPYYDITYEKMKDSLSPAQFNQWYWANHYVDQYTQDIRPISIWTTMLPKNPDYVVLEEPNNNWWITDVKEEYWNKNYTEDSRGYANPTSKWKNSQYDKLMASNNKALLEFYEFFKENMHIADEKLPKGYRLGHRLPAIRKNLMQRIVDAGTENASKVIKESVKDRLIRRTDDTDVGQVVNEANEVVNYIPVHFTQKIDPAEMSFDLTSLLSSFYFMASNHHNYSMIIDTVEGAKELLKERTFSKTDSAGRKLKNILPGLENTDVVGKGITSNAYKQIEDYLNRIVYGHMNNYLGFIDVGGVRLDNAKLLDNLNAYSSYSLLALNFIASTLNVVQGESMNLTEAIGGQFFTRHGYASASTEYTKEVGAIIADVGKRKPSSKVNLLNELLDTLGNYSTDVVHPQENTRFKTMMKTNTLFFLNNSGEHLLQSRVMIAMLKNIKPVDKSGAEIKDLPTMYDAFIVKDGKITLDDRVANFGEKEQKTFTRKMQFILRRLHGNHNRQTSVKWQADARLRLIGAMRKWIVPGIVRRWDTKKNNEFGEVVTEGMYRTTGKFFGALLKDLKQLKFEIGANWDKMDTMEKENVRRTLTEISIFLTAVAASVVLYSLAGGDDKDKKGKNTAMLYTAYIALRLRKELTFYINPLSTMQILRSPAASMSVIESGLKLINQLVYNPTERYVHGARKGELKLHKRFEDAAPVYKHFRRTFTQEGIEDQLAWLLK